MNKELELIDAAVKEINSRAALSLADKGFMLDVLLDLRNLLTNK